VVFADRCGRKYQRKHSEAWEAIHNDPLLGVARAAEIVPEVLPEEFPTPKSFRELRFETAADVRDLAGEIIELVRKRTRRQNILFLVDEAGQYVAPRGDGQNGVYFAAAEGLDGWYMSALLVRERSAESLRVDDGPYDDFIEACDAGVDAAMQWCLAHRVQYSERKVKGIYQAIRQEWLRRYESRLRLPGC
jgi:hypothetical protein